MCRANEICRESKRQTINADDVLKAVEELDFPEFSEPLMRCLSGQSDHYSKPYDYFSIFGMAFVVCFFRVSYGTCSY